MKLTVEKQEINEGLQKAAAIMPAKAGAAYLRSLWLKADAGKLSIMTTDANLEFTGVYDAEIESGGLIGVPGRSFVDLIKQMPGGAINFSLDGENKNLLIRQGRKNYKLPISTADWFQELAPFPDEPAVSMAADILLDLLESIAYCIDDDDNRDALACMYFKAFDDSIEVCGLNGHQFAMKVIVNPELGARIADGGLLIQKKYLSDIRKWLGGDASEIVELNFTPKRLYLRRRDGMEMLSLPRAHYEYPDYNVFLSRVDNEQASTMVAPRKEAIDALGRIAVFNTEIERCVFMHLGENALEMSAQGADGSGVENLEVEYGGRLEQIAFPTRDLMEIFNHFKSTELKMIFTGQESPCGIRGIDDKDYTVIIMPMKAQEKNYYEEN